jgi:hypothetical protein
MQKRLLLMGPSTAFLIVYALFYQQLYEICMPMLPLRLLMIAALIVTINVVYWGFFTFLLKKILP